MEPQAENSSAPFAGHTADSFLTKTHYLHSELEDNQKSQPNEIDIPYLNTQPKLLVDTVKTMDSQRKLNNHEFPLSYRFAEESVHIKSKPLFWCMSCQSPLSQCDVNYRMTPNVPSCLTTIPIGTYFFASIFINYLLLEGLKVGEIVHSEIYGELNVYLLVWTTSPWSLILNEAFILSPDSQYILVGIFFFFFAKLGVDLQLDRNLFFLFSYWLAWNDKCLILSSESIALVKHKLAEIARISGNDLLSFTRRVMHPIFSDRYVPLFASSLGT